MKTETHIYYDIRSRVRAGAQLLDRVLPGWAERIDVHTLNMNDTRTCVLGQLYNGAYHRGTQALLNYNIYQWEGEEHQDPAINHGFDLTADEWESTHRPHRLRMFWLYEIVSRREKA